MIREDLLVALPGEIAERLRIKLPGLKSCQPIWGPFDVNELKERGIAAPAVLISCLSAVTIGTRAGPEYDYGLRMMAYVVTRDRLGLARDDAAASITGALLREIPDKNWGQYGVAGARDLRAHVLVNAKTRDVAASLFVVEWVQPVSFAEVAPGEVLPLELYVGQAPEVGPDHLDDYERIGDAS